MMTLSILLFIALGLGGLPIFAIIGGIALAGFFFSYGKFDSMAILLGEMYRIAENPLFITIPLFTLAGYLMAESKTSTRLINLTRAFFGWLPGGTAVVALLSCAFFTVFTGVSGVTIIALGGLLHPVLLKEHYPQRFTLGLLTTGGSRGMLFPPSLPIIIYGVIAQVSIDKLFIAGILPGLLDILTSTAFCIYMGIRSGVPRHPFSGRAALRSLGEAFWELPIPVIIFGGIYGGFITANEAAVAIALYVFIIEVFVYRDLRLRDMPRVVRESMILVGGLFIIIGVAFGLTNYLIDQDVPMKLFTAIQPYITSPLKFLIAMNVFLLVVAALLDVYSAILVVLPLILPIAANYGVNPIHLGIVFLVNLEIGYSAPPLGLNLYVASFRFKRPITELFRATLPFLGLVTLVLILITYYPPLSLWLLQETGVK